MERGLFGPHFFMKDEKKKEIFDKEEERKKNLKEAMKIYRLNRKIHKRKMMEL